MKRECVFVVMEDELRCPLCKQLYVNPVLLPCSHALCLTCALDSQVQITNNNNNNNNSSTTSIVTAQIHQPPPPPPPTLNSTPNHQPTQSNQSQANQVPLSSLPPNNNTSGQSGNSSTSESISSDQDTADKVSILSEADSGVICTSRPSSYAGTPANLALLFPPSGGAVYSLTCPACRKIVFFDDGGARNLPTYRAYSQLSFLSVSFFR